MRVVLLLATAASGAAAATMWLMPVATETELAVVREVGAGGVARLERPAAPAAPAASRDHTAIDAPAAPRFFGFALPFLAPGERLWD